MAVMMGGQVAEEIAFGDISTGAANDLQKANGVARKMVTEYGMSEDLGPRTFETGQSQIFLGKELGQGTNYSEAVAARIDAEMDGFLCEARDRAADILKANRGRLTLLAKRLLSVETIEGTELKELLSGFSLNEAPLAAD